MKLKKIVVPAFAMAIVSASVASLSASASYDKPGKSVTYSMGWTGSYCVPRTYNFESYTVKMEFKLSNTNYISTTVGSGVPRDSLKAYVSETNKNGTTKTKGPTSNGKSGAVTVTLNPSLFTPVKSMHVGYSGTPDYKYTFKQGY